MSLVKDLIKREISRKHEVDTRNLEFLYNFVSGKFDALFNKLDDTNKVTFKKCLVSVRNWINTILLCIILGILLSSCFVSGRTVHVVTPKVELSADTATAYTWPYNTKYQ